MRPVVAVVAALAATGVLGATLTAQAPADPRALTVTLLPPHVEGLAALHLEVEIDGRHAGTIAARKRDVTVEPTLSFTLAAGFRRYGLSGFIQMDSGRRYAIEGSGVMVSPAFLEEKLAAPDQLTALEALLVAYRAALGVPATVPRLERGRRPDGAATNAAQRRLGITFPATYTWLLRTYGPFVYVVHGDEGGEEPGAVVYAPDAVRTVPDWRRQVRKAPLEPGDTPAAKAKVALLDRDAVIARSLDTSWVVRAGSQSPCADGSASVTGEFIDETRPGEELWNADTDSYAAYFGDEQPECGDRAPRLREAFTGAFVNGFSQVAAIPGRDGRLRVKHDVDRSAPGIVRLHFGEH